MESSDPPSAGLYLLILGLLLLCSMFFSASETAFLSSSRLHIRYLKEKKNRSAARVEKLLRNKTLFLNTILIGNNVVNIATSSIVTALAIHAFGDAGVGVATVIATVTILVFGEILPKSAALSQPERFALKVSLPLSLLIFIAAPVSFAFTLVTGALAFLIGGRKKADAETVTEEDLKTLIEVGEEEGVIESHERAMLHKILAYTDLNTRDIMTPRTDIISVPIGASRREILDLSRSSRYSRFPVVGEDIDDIRGILYIKDFLFTPVTDDDSFDVRNILRPALFVFENLKISDVQKLLRAENQNMAIVLDEYGGTAGLVSTEDLVEEIFGGIRDEYDRASPVQSVAHDSASLVIGGGERIDEVNRKLGTRLSSDFYDTIGGFIMEKTGDVPCKGNAIDEQGYTFTVTKVTGHRIDEVKAERRGGAQ